MSFRIAEGNYEKMGVSVERVKENHSFPNKVTFTFFGEKEDDCVLVLVNRTNREETRLEVPREFCLGSLRSIAVENINLNEYCYYFEVNGKKKPDPYAHAIVGRSSWKDFSREENDYEIINGFDAEPFDWKEDKNPEIAKEDMVMYKLHVRGFSMGAAGGKKRGTFSAIKKRIDYFKKLNVTTLELMPVYEFEEMDIPKKLPLPDYIQWEQEKEDVITPNALRKASDKVNFWGYVKGDYFAVKASYAQCPARAAYEFKDFIRTLHENNMECVMEMFFPEEINHNMVMDILRFWVRTYHVDGFHLLGGNLPITAIMQDAILSRTKIFYRDFVENTFVSEKRYKNFYVYKDEYQFPARKLLNHINPDIREFVDQQRKQGTNLGYINYVASNNGFSLADVFMYNDKHNEANGENNQDGENWNLSNNYGEEGPSRKKYIVKTRKQKWTNAMVMLFLAQGVPLIWEGDEISNSNGGNNNTYCQDNLIGWVDWKNERKNQKDIKFLQKLSEFRRNHPVLRSPVPFHFNDYQSSGFPDLSYHGDSAWLLDIDRGKMNLGMMYSGDYSSSECKDSVYVAYNFYSAVSTLALPKLKNKKKWYLVMDSSLEERFLEEEKLVDKNVLELKPQSICILIGK